MVLSGITMRRPIIGKYKVAETFYDSRMKTTTEIELASEEDDMYSLMVEHILAKSKTIEEVRSRLIDEEVLIPHCQRKNLWSKLIGIRF